MLLRSGLNTDCDNTDQPRLLAADDERPNPFDVYWEPVIAQSLEPNPFDVYAPDLLTGTNEWDALDLK